MNKVSTVVMGIIGVAILMVIFPIIMSSTQELQTTRQVDTFAAVTTGAAETTSEVTLSRGLYSDDTSYVLSITSDVGTDTPVAGTYVPSTNSLTVTGLTASEIRALVVTYEYDALTAYTGMSAMVGMTPLLIWVAILAIVVGGTWFAFKGS